MIPWLQIYDKIHYGKWLPDFWSEMSTSSEEISQYIPSIFSHSITGKPYSSIPTDLWIEMTMNKGSKMKAGWQRILGNETMLLSNIKTTNYINQLRATLHKIAEMKSYKLDDLSWTNLVFRILTIVLLTLTAIPLIMKMYVYGHFSLESLLRKM